MRTNVITRSVLLTVAIATATAFVHAQSPQNSSNIRPVASDAVPKGPTISPRDVVRIEVLGPAHDKFSGVFPVGLDGYIEYPRLGRIDVRGMTAEALSAELKKRLADQLVDPQVIVGLDPMKNKHVFVTGEVRSVAEVPYANSITVRQALILASGVTEEAAAEATIVSAGRPNQTVDLIGLMSGDPNTPDPVLQDGDTVIVAKAKPVFIQGPVNSPGKYTVRPGTTVQQLVTMAGGITEKGKESGIKIQRPYADPKKKPQEIPVKDWKTEVVKPGDVVIVPKRLW